MQLPIPKNIVIVAGGLPSLRTLRSLVPMADFVIGCDKGCEYLLMNDLPIHLAVGDFDSLDKSFFSRLKNLQIPIEFHPQEKNFSDLELALHAACSYLQTSVPESKITITCAGGARADFAFTNALLLLNRAFLSFQVSIIEDDHKIYPLQEKKNFTTSTVPGGLFSIAVLGDTTVTIRGAKWDLEKEPVKIGSQRLVSNLAIAEIVSVQLHQTSGLFFKHKGTDTVD